MIAKGDIVKLKSGGPRMTVVRTWEQMGTVAADGTMAFCQWFNGTKLEQASFHIEALSEV